MNKNLLLLGVGGAGTTMVRGVTRAFSSPMHAHAVDTDAASGSEGGIPFTLLGGNRLAGRGSGGQPAEARAAFEDDPGVLDPVFDGLRTCVVLAALGGGTGGGATGGILKRLHSKGVSTLLFATLPFSFEGADRERAAKSEAATLAREADVSVFLPLDDLVAGVDNMTEALRQAHDMVSSGVTLLWRLLEKPGYIRMDPERLHAAIAGAGRARFAAAAAAGENRVGDVLAALAANPLLSRSNGAAPVRTIVAGVLAGDDLRLSEVAAVASGLSAAFGPDAKLEIGTVNDEQTFSGRLAVSVLLFEESPAAASKPAALAAARNPLAAHDRFGKTDKTIWEGEDLDIPTYLRRNLTLEK
jgi:cell division protein FtsZ